MQRCKGVMWRTVKAGSELRSLCTKRSRRFSAGVRSTGERRTTDVEDIRGSLSFFADTLEFERFACGN